MSRRTLIALVVLTASLLVAVVAGTGSARTTQTKRYTTGNIHINGPSSLNIQVVNESSRQFGTTVKLEHGTGFLSTADQSLIIPPHGIVYANYACTSSGTCDGALIVITQNGAFPSAQYIPDSSSTTPEFINIAAGEWRTF